MKTKEQASSTDLVKQGLNVPFSYPVYFTHNIFDPANPVLGDVLRLTGESGARTAVFIDSGVHEAHPHAAQQACTYLSRIGEATNCAGPPCIVPGGEQAKNGWTEVNRIIEKVTAANLDRHSYILAIGGGAFLDAIGFAAGIFHRGIRLIRVPTTTLSQDDSGVGVKNGINSESAKNMLGTFAPPFAVINDFNFLTTLSRSLILDGIAEAFKVAIIKDYEFFEFLEEQAPLIKAMDIPAIEAAVQWCAEIHLDHISGSDDPFEFGVSRPLDFGHWSAHMLESMSDYTIRHGQAVAMGIAIDTCYARRKGLLNTADRDRILTAMRRTGLRLFDEQIMEQDKNGDFRILKGIKLFQEHLGGKLAITLPTGIGTSKEVDNLDTEIISTCIQAMGQPA